MREKKKNKSCELFNDVNKFDHRVKVKNIFL